MRDYELPPREESDPYNRDRGQVSRADLYADLYEWDELVQEHGIGCWDCEQVKEWLRGA